MTSPYQTALEEGYEPNEVLEFLSKHPSYSSKISQAREEGYTDEEIGNFLQRYRPSKPKKSVLEKVARLGAQYGLGALEGELFPYEVAVAPLSSKDAQNVAYRETLGEDLERLLEQKATGVWDEQDEALLKNIKAQIADPEESEKFVQTLDIGVRDLASKATGIDFTPEGVLEKASSWAGFIKNPKNWAQLAKKGLTYKDVIKAIAPSGKEALRGLGAGGALEMAEQGDLGPIGTLASAVIGDMAGGGVAGVLKGSKEVLTRPKQTLAKVAAKFTPREKVDLQKNLIEDFRKSGIQADIGTLTNSELLKWMQTRLAQSGLTGKALEDLRKTMTSEIRGEYESLAKTLGESKFTSTHEAGEVIKENLKKIRETDLQEIRKLYSEARESLSSQAFVPPHRLAGAIRNLEAQLKPGSLKAGEQKVVLDALKTLKRDMYDASGSLMYASVPDLMNNKIALNDIINYEVQGGAKQLLKGIVKEIDRAIVSHIKENPSFGKKYIKANQRFSEHAKSFRNREIDKLLSDASDPEQIFNKMNSVEGIRKVEKLLKKSPQGPELFNRLSRLKLDRTIGDNMVDSTTQHLKLGTFSKLLEKGKNRQVIKELLPTSAFKRLELLQKNAGKLADTAQKFLNASKSGVTIIDVGVVGKALNDMAHLLSGNPWPAVKTGTGLLGGRYLTHLMGDTEFLKLVEEAIKASEKGNSSRLMKIGEQLEPKIRAALSQSPILEMGVQAQSEVNR